MIGLTEEEALIVALLKPDDDCAHNFAPLFAEVDRIVARRVAAALRPVEALAEDMLRQGDACQPDLLAAITQGRKDAQ